MKKWKRLFPVHVFLNHIKRNIFGDIKTYLSTIFKSRIMSWGGGGCSKKYLGTTEVFDSCWRGLDIILLNPFSIIVCHYNFFSFEDQLQHACTFFFDSYYDKRLHRWKMNETNMYINMSSIYISYIFKIWKKSFAKLLCNRKQNVTWNTDRGT